MHRVGGGSAAGFSFPLGRLNPLSFEAPIVHFYRLKYMTDVRTRSLVSQIVRLQRVFRYASRLRIGHAIIRYHTRLTYSVRCVYPILSQHDAYPDQFLDWETRSSFWKERTGFTSI